MRGRSCRPRARQGCSRRRSVSWCETVLILPFAYNDLSMLWQADTGFYFYMPGGYTSQVIPPPFADQPTVDQLLDNVPPSRSALESFIRTHYISYIVVDTVDVGAVLPGEHGAEQSPWPEFLARIGLHGRQVGGILLYAVPPAWLPS
jgi:hypothetical protein